MGPSGLLAASASSGGSTGQWRCFSMFLKGGHPHRTTSGCSTRTSCGPAGINEEGQDLVPHVVHQRPMQTSSREAGAFSTRGLLLSDIRDLPAEHQVSAQEENTRATTLCDSIFYKWVPHQLETVCKLVQLAAVAGPDRLLRLCQDHSACWQNQ